MHGTRPVDDERVRRWLTNLRRPDRLDEPALRELLRAHGCDATGPALRTGRAAADLLREKIDALRPPEGTSSSEALPHRVLKTCFVEGAKSYQAAARLGVSERQLSRERSRAISLLAAELAAVPLRAAPPAPGAPDGLLERPALVARLDEALAGSARVHVTGPAGCGKTTVVAAWAAGAERVSWHAALPHLGGGLPALLFELGEDLAVEDPSLAAYVRASLPSLDTGLACRIALAALRGAPRVLVLDDLDAGRIDPATDRFLGTIAGTLPACRIVTAGRGAAPPGTASVVLPPRSRAEVRTLLTRRGADGELAAPLHAWTRGNARLADAAAGWLATGSMAALTAAARDDDAIVHNLTTLMWCSRRGAA